MHFELCVPGAMCLLLLRHILKTKPSFGHPHKQRKSGWISLSYRTLKWEGINDWCFLMKKLLKWSVWKAMRNDALERETNSNWLPCSEVYWLCNVGSHVMFLNLSSHSLKIRWLIEAESRLVIARDREEGAMGCDYSMGIGLLFFSGG